MNEYLIRLIYFVLIFITIFFDAWGDAIIDNKKGRNHFIELLVPVAFLGIVTMMYYNFLHPAIIVLDWIFLRLGIFNLTYNHFRNLPSNYVGTTDGIYDKWLGKLKKLDKKEFWFNLVVNVIIYGSIFASIVTILWKVYEY